MAVPKTLKHMYAFLLPLFIAVSLLGSSGPVAARQSVQFPICGIAIRITCVIDGDTFWLNGTKIRLEDIDAPEISSPMCRAEARRGQMAKKRLQQLLQSGELNLIRHGTRDHDRYGRLLRTAEVAGRSIGTTLIDEGLAHPWDGYKHSWCN